jgi:hypothetical protein
VPIWAKLDGIHKRMTVAAAKGHTRTESAEAARFLGNAVKMWAAGITAGIETNLDSAQEMADKAMTRRAASGRSAKAISEAFDR